MCCGAHGEATGQVVEIQLSPSTMWDLGTELRLHGLASEHLYGLSHLIHPPTYGLLKSSCGFKDACLACQWQS